MVLVERTTFFRAFWRRSRWATLLVLVAFASSLLIVPSTFVSASESMSMEMEHMADGSMDAHDPCCDDCKDCDDTGNKTCDNSAMCNAACGKVPMQLGSLDIYKPSPIDDRLGVLLTDTLSGLSQSPPKRPPKRI